MIQNKCSSKDTNFSRKVSYVCKQTNIYTFTNKHNCNVQTNKQTICTYCNCHKKKLFLVTLTTNRLCKFITTSFQKSKKILCLQNGQQVALQSNVITKTTIHNNLQQPVAVERMLNVKYLQNQTKVVQQAPSKHIWQQNVHEASAK